MSITRNLLVVALLASSGNAMAASSVDLAVTGTITPSACTPSLANGGVADFGKVSAKDLRPDWPTYLPHQSMQMTVTCDAATLFAIAPTDNREGSESDLDYYNFGIGMINGSEKLGYLTAALFNRMADGVPVSVIGSRDGGQTWAGEQNFMDDGLTAFAENGTRVPIAIQQLTTDLQIQAVIAASQNLTLNKEESIDGSVTLTVKYL